MTPQYTRKETIAEGVTLYLGDSREVVSALDGIDAVVTDNPYGGRFNFDSTRFTGGTDDKAMGAGRSDRGVSGDEVEFDPTPWLRFPEVVLWGANHFAARLPIGSTLVWLKKAPKHYGTRLSDAEIGWQSGGYGVYAFHAPDSNARRRLEHAGSVLAAETAHPTQKPVALMRWCIERTRGRRVCDPYMGSGTTGVAAIELGREFVGVEKVPAYFDIACRRIEAATRQISLFKQEIAR
jgi:site-specific DNA-methyltransferase (adenine-specific)